MNTRPGRPGAARPAPRARHFAWACLAYSAFVVYGSLVPLDCRSVPFAEAVESFRAALRVPVRVESRSDCATNVILFIPLGFLLAAVLCVDRPRIRGLIAVLVVPVACAALSAAIEFAQVYVRSRTTSLRDIVAETVGGTIGVVLWASAGGRLSAWARRLRWVREGGDRVSWLLPGYLVLVTAVHLMPLDLTISPVELYHKYRWGGIRLVPFVSLIAAPGEVAAGLAWTALYLAPVGVLLALIDDRRRRGWPQILGLGLAFAGLIELLQLPVISRTTDTSSVAVGGLSVLTGWYVTRLVRRPRLQSRESVAHLGGLRALRNAVLVAWIGVLVCANWWPFDFDLGLASLAGRLERVSWLPLADYYAATEYHAFDQILQKLLLFLPVGVALGVSGLGAGVGAGRGGPLAFLAGLALAAFLEAGQLALPGRYPSVTDVLIGGAGARLGFAAACGLRSGSRGPSRRRGAASLPRIHNPS